MALTRSQTVDRREAVLFDYPVAAATTIYQGGLVALDGSNNLVAASDAAARRVVGVAYEEVDNSGGSAGDLRCKVEIGCLKLTNSGSNAVTDAHIGRACFVEDDETVASDPGTNSVVAGIVAKVDDDGVWVFAGVPFGSISPVTVALTSTNGTAAAASADLAALAAEAEKIGDDVRAIHAALKLHGLVK